MTIRYLICISISLLTVVTSVGQQNSEAVKEIEKIRSYYNGPELKHLKGNMRLTEMKSNKDIDNMDFDYWIAGKNVLVKMSYVEILMNDELYIMVNKRRKTIFIRPVSSVANIDQNAMMPFGPDQLKQLVGTGNAKILLSKSAETSNISLSGLKGTKFSSLSILYNTDYSLNKLEGFVQDGYYPSMKPGEKLRVIIAYATTIKEATYSQNIFSSGQFVSGKSGGVYQPIGKYATFTKL